MRKASFEDGRSPPDQFATLWQIMQGVELCRHRAETAERRATSGSRAYRQEMAEIAQQWRRLAAVIERMAAGLDRDRGRASAEGPDSAETLAGEN